MVADTKPQHTVLEILKSCRNANRVMKSAEIIPPRNGAETEAIFRQIDVLKEVPVEFISVTKGAGGSLRGGTLPIAQMIKSRYDLCALAHFTCRDYTVEEIENNLMDHFYFGVNNILALRGDPPDGQPDGVFDVGPGRHAYAWQLVEQIKLLNEGCYISRKNFDKAGEPRKGTQTQFCIGVAAHPEQEPFSDAVAHFAKKVEAGADFAITQMIYSAENYEKFLEACSAKGVHIPVLPGLRILTQASTAERMMTKFGIKVPAELTAKLAAAKSKDDARKIGIEFSEKLCRKLIKAGAPGIHLFIMNDEKSAAEVFKSL